MKLPNWLQDEGVQCFSVPEHVGKVVISQGHPAIETDAYKLGLANWSMSDTKSPFGLACTALFPNFPPDGHYYLVRREEECGRCGPGYDAEPMIVCPCQGTGTLTTHHLIKEDAEELDMDWLWTDHQPEEPRWRPEEDIEAHFEFDKRTLLFLHPDGQRHEVKK